MSKVGYIKLYRKTLENPVVMKDADHLAIWCWLLMTVTKFPRDVLFDGGTITLQPGQWTTGRKIIASELHISESKVYRTLKLFESEQLIEQQTDRKCTLITVVNWDKYQEDEQQSEQQVNNDRTTSEQQVNTKKESKEREKVKKVKKNTYGEMNNVRLTDDELVKLREKFPYDYKKRIDDLSIYMASKGDKYKSHYSTILSWSRKNGDAPKVVKTYKEPERVIADEEKITPEEFDTMMANIRGMF